MYRKLKINLPSSDSDTRPPIIFHDTKEGVKGRVLKPNLIKFTRSGCDHEKPCQLCPTADVLVQSFHYLDSDLQVAINITHRIMLLCEIFFEFNYFKSCEFLMYWMEHGRSSMKAVSSISPKLSRDVYMKYNQEISPTTSEPTDEFSSESYSNKSNISIESTSEQSKQTSPNDNQPGKLSPATPSTSDSSIRCSDGACGSCIQ